MGHFWLAPESRKDAAVGFEDAVGGSGVARAGPCLRPQNPGRHGTCPVGPGPDPTLGAGGVSQKNASGGYQIIDTLRDEWRWIDFGTGKIMASEID